ncbi:MAG: arginase family protein [Chloroflexia bacterium]|nr:arginase family protein [Chloroflexia bacterium]
MELDIVSVPYRYDARGEGLGAGPDALLRAGIGRRLTAKGMAVGEPREALVPEADLEAGRTAVNIGKLGARAAALVAAGCHAGRAVLILAGDDTVAVGVVAGAQIAAGPGATVGLVWLDAHGDFNTPETSYSGILAGMPVAVIAGLAGPLWRDAAGLAAPLPTDRILLAGIRDLDEKEEALLRATNVRIVRAGELCGETFRATLDRLASRCTHLCVHVDLDLLDPRFVPSASTPAAEGPTVGEAAEALALVLATGKVATLCVAGLNPGAGERGKTSLGSAIGLLEQAVPAWTTVPSANG